MVYSSLVPITISAVFPWVLAINPKVAVIVEKLPHLADRIEQDFQEHGHWITRQVIINAGLMIMNIGSPWSRKAIAPD